MPPKGWKKNAQGNYPTTSYIKEQEKLTIDDLLFPKTIVTSLAKYSIQEIDSEKKVLISKDASLALQRSATVFVNHLLMFTREISKNDSKKSCREEDVLNALDQLGFGGFKSIIRQKLDDYNQFVQLKKEQQKKQRNSTSGETEEIVDSERELEHENDGDDSEQIIPKKPKLHE